MRLSPNLVTLSDPRSAAAEAFRALRTNLMFSSVEAPLSTLLVTSPAPEEGKSTTLANLAVTMAQAGRQTILVDCDLRRPSQPEIWGLANDHGLTTMILDSGGLANPPLQDVGVENLSVLLSGPNPPNPADLLGSRKMDEVITALKSRAEVVLFDAPPVLAVTDAALLGLKLDGVLLVMSAGHTRRDHAEQAKELLEKVHIRIVGVVLNNAPPGAGMGKYYG